MPKYALVEDGCEFQTVEAESAEAALADFDPEESADYDTSRGTVWVRIHARNVDDREDDASRTYQIDQDEPPCPGGDEHDWQTPHDIVGGVKENPGVVGHGGGIIMAECCMHCGMRKKTDTWAQNPDDGTQGHTTVTYSEPGHYDLSEDE